MTKNRSALRGRTLSLAACAWAVITPAVFAGNGNISDAVSAQAPCGSYTVVRGDTLESIALRKTGTRAATHALYRINAQKLSSPDEIIPGMILSLPCKTDFDGEIADDQYSSERDASFSTWQAAAGDFLVPVLTQWGEQAGYTVIIEQNADWRFGVSYSQNSSIRAAIEDVIVGFSTSARPPVVVFYTNNVMTIGTR